MKIVVITGATGIGKTKISLNICKDINKVIINADASQFKKELNIGTAKIPASERNVPQHELFDFLDIDKNFSIYDYQKIIRPLLKKNSNNNIVSFLVGGSGLYIKAALFDYDLSVNMRDFTFEKQYEVYTNEELHFMLEKLDNKSSLQIHPNNRRRVLRALDLAQKGDFASLKNKKEVLIYDAIFINLITSREILYARINKRYDKMIANGWIDEVIMLRKHNVDFSKIKEIGYNDINDFLDNKIAFKDCSDLIKKKTRNYAKRQITWIQNQLPCIDVEMNYANINVTINEINRIIKSKS